MPQYRAKFVRICTTEVECVSDTMPSALNEAWQALMDKQKDSPSDPLATYEVGSERLVAIEEI